MKDGHALGMDSLPIHLVGSKGVCLHGSTHGVSKMGLERQTGVLQRKCLEKI